MDRPLTAEDIQWQSPPVQRLEDADWLLLTESETGVYLRELQSETRILRAALHETLTQLQLTTTQLERALRLLRSQRP